MLARKHTDTMNLSELAETHPEMIMGLYAGLKELLEQLPDDEL